MQPDSQLADFNNSTEITFYTRDGSSFVFCTPAYRALVLMKRATGIGASRKFWWSAIMCTTYYYYVTNIHLNSDACCDDAHAFISPSLVELLNSIELSRVNLVWRLCIVRSIKFIHSHTHKKMCTYIRIYIVQPKE